MSEAKETKLSENKTKPTPKSVDEFINEIENTRRKLDAITTLEICKEVTGFPAVMWGPSIIGFGCHHYVYESGREGDVPAVGFSPRKTKIAFYVGDKFVGADELFANLGKHKKSKACLYINKLDDVDLDILREIIVRDFKKSNQQVK